MTFLLLLRLVAPVCQTTPTVMKSISATNCIFSEVANLFIV